MRAYSELLGWQESLCADNFLKWHKNSVPILYSAVINRIELSSHRNEGGIGEVKPSYTEMVWLMSRVQLSLGWGCLEFKNCFFKTTNANAKTFLPP
jgi:hypothetical protein